MVNMIGFHHKSPFDGIMHYTYGDENWRVRITQLGGDTVRYVNRNAHALFGFSTKRGHIDARDFVDHPGDIAIFARLHLALSSAKRPLPRQLDSGQVQDLIATPLQQGAFDLGGIAS